VTYYAIILECKWGDDKIHDCDVDRCWYDAEGPFETYEEARRYGETTSLLFNVVKAVTSG